MLRGPRIGVWMRSALVVALSGQLLAACGDSGGATDTSGSTGISTATPSAAPLGGIVQLSWTPPLENTDGSMLTDLAGYRVYYGMSLRALDRVVDLPWSGNVSHTVEIPEAGTWYFTIRAYNLAGVESDFSVTASTTIG